MAASNKSDGLDAGMECTSCESTAAIPFNIISIQAHYIPRIGQLRIEQSLATEESPHSHQITLGKEKTLITTVILETLEELLNADNSQTDKRKKKTQLSLYKERL
jgi:hypothetical protein